MIPARLTVCAAPSFTVTFANAFNVGASFTVLTVTVNVLVTMLLLAPPSLTVTVTVADPEALATGVNASEPVAFGLEIGRAHV